MIDINTIKEAEATRVAQLNDLLPKLAAAKQEYEEMDAMRMDMEADIASLRERFDDEMIVTGEWSDQMAHDFSIEKYGRNKRIISGYKSGKFAPCECDIQCPDCKKYAVHIQYNKYLVKVLEGQASLFSIAPANPKAFRDSNGFIYCDECSEMRKPQKRRKK
jgi:hypothetical protein